MLFQLERECGFLIQHVSVLNLLLGKLCRDTMSLHKIMHKNEWVKSTFKACWSAPSPEKHSSQVPEQKNAEREKGKNYFLENVREQMLQELDAAYSGIRRCLWWHFLQRLHIVWWYGLQGIHSIKADIIVAFIKKSLSVTIFFRVRRRVLAKSV